MNTTDILAFVAIADGFVGWLVGLIVGAAGLYAVLHVLRKTKIAASRVEAQAIVADATAKADQIRKTAEVDAKDEHLKRLEQFEKETAETRKELKETERRLAKREDNFEAKLDTLGAKERKLEQTQTRLDERAASVKKRGKDVEELIVQQRAELHRITGISAEEGKALLLSKLSAEIEQETAQMVSEAISNAKEEARNKSRDVILTAIQRYAAEHTSEATVSTVSIPSDDMKAVSYTHLTLPTSDLV